MAAFGGWIAQAYGGSLEHTARNLAAIPVRPMPWEVLWHLWANLLVGPFVDRRLAEAMALIAGALFGVSFLTLRRSQRSREWNILAVAAWLPSGIGALLALRWPFFAARYFAMSAVPLLALIVLLMLRSPWKGILPLWVLPGLIGIAGFPLFNAPVLGLEIEPAIAPLSISEPVLIQARWHLLWTERSGFSSYEWPDPAQRAQVIDRSPSFWFIGVTPYRVDWEGWLRDLQATHLIDFQAEFPHAIPEYRASVFHLVRKVPAARWTQPDARWANGIRLREVGWAQEA
ncbi:MAG: hypothetical protein RMM07_14155, partial [Anaerolineae bacterium]|nr:hypothetical protein [Anaerolineae bacterium]